MREIKFRGLSGKDWVYGTVLEMYFYGVKSIHICEGVYGGDIDSAQVDPETIGQFVFRRDKKGDEVYEGDTLYDGISCIFNVEYSIEEAAFVLVVIGDGEVVRFDEYDFDRLELVGTIHEIGA